MTKVSGYQPTAEQIAAQQARREAQQAAKAAKKAKPFGGKTVFDKETGKWVSQSADEVRANAQKTGLMSKIGKYAKKFGKVALIGAAVAGVVAGGVWLYNKLTGKKDEAAEPLQAKQNQPEKTEDPKNQENPGAVEDKQNPAKTPAPTEEDNKVDDKKVDETKEKEPTKELPKDYEVKKGDCVWNIAKQHLKDLSEDPSYKPTNAEILKHTKELMDLNQLQFEPDGYHVMIRPKDVLKLTA